MRDEEEVRLQLRCSPELRQRVKIAALKAGMTVEGLLEAAVLQWLKARKEEGSSGAGRITKGY